MTSRPEPRPSPGSRPSPTGSPPLSPLLVLAVVVAVGLVLVTAIAVRHGGPSAPAGRSAVEAATLRRVPDPGTTGASTCTDPIGGRQWRVTWRAVSTARPGTANESAGTSLGARLAARAAVVDLVPTGFALRTQPGATARQRTTVTPVAARSTPAAAGLSPATGRPSSSLNNAPDPWRSRDQDRWELRWNPTPAQAASDVGTDGWQRAGSLADLAAVPQRVAQDPRYVTPDGACTVYLRPFVDGTAGTRGANTVAVVGDSLVAQVSRPQSMAGLLPGQEGTAGARLLDGRLTPGHLVEIDGQPGRRWTTRPAGSSPIEDADATMVDELRGLRDADAVVAALGTNDAGWVALAGDRPDFELRLTWVLQHLGQTLDELRRYGHCTVVTTVADRAKDYGGSGAGAFGEAAGRINELLRSKAAADPHDGLLLQDWARVADAHSTGEAQPWFGVDTIHFSLPGLGPYADELSRAAELC